MMEGAVSAAIQRPIAFNYYNHRKFSATILRQSDRDISFLIVHQTTHFFYKIYVQTETKKRGDNQSSKFQFALSKLFLC